MARATKFIGDVVVTGTLTTTDGVVSGTLTTGSTVDANAAITNDLTLATNKKLQLRDTHAFVNSSAQGKVTISADAATADAISLTGKVTLTDDAVVATGKQIKPKGGTATGSSAAATVSQQCGVVTSEALTTAGLAAYTLTLTNTLIASTSIVLVSLCNGTNSQGVLLLGKVTPGAGSATIECRNVHATEAFNGTIKIAFLVVNPS